MTLRRLLTLPLLAAVLLAAAASGARADEKKAAPPAADTKAVDTQIYNALRDVINHGADLYNPPKSDHLGCYRLYEGTLVAYKLLLAHRPNLQKAIDDGLEKAKTASLQDKAFVLRDVIDLIRKETNPNPMAVTPPIAKTLWERLGGEKGVSKVVDDFFATASKDPKVNFDRDGKYKNADIPALKKKVVELISSVSNGPFKYAGLGMKEAHKGMWITNEEFDATAKHLSDALMKNGVKDAEYKAVMDVVSGMRSAIVEGKKPEKPPVATTLWDKLGGEKVVTQIVEDFFATASKDKKVNLDRDGKFKREGEAAANAKKMLVAWISAQTGGELKYNGKSMKDAHKGMAITSDEFDATGMHLADALKKNKVKEEDAKALLAIFMKFKADVVEPKKSDPPVLIPDPVPVHLWDRLGKDAGVGKIVDEFVNATLADTNIKFYRDAKPTLEQKAKLKKNLVELISELSHGPYKYTGKDMKEAHKGMKITAAEFDATAKHLEMALKNNKIKDDDIKKIMDAIAATKVQIVEVKP